MREANSIGKMVRDVVSNEFRSLKIWIPGAHGHDACGDALSGVSASSLAKISVNDPHLDSP
jgi:hypothetical protein